MTVGQMAGHCNPREIETMNTKIATTAALMLFLTASGVQAEVPAGALYANELGRCVAALRTELLDADTRQLRYTVTRLDTRGAWYEFEIRSEVFNELEGPVVRSEQSSCRAHRWSNDTELTS